MSDKREQWELVWRDPQGDARALKFELGRGLRYRVVIPKESDKRRFLDAFLRPPETALLTADGGMLGNIKVDENLLLPLSYRGVDTELLETTVMELFRGCGLNEQQTRSLLEHLPHQLSPYQKRLVGFVRAVLVRPKVMVYASIWNGVSHAEIAQLKCFDTVLHDFVPECTSVFVDYDTDTCVESPLHVTYCL